MGLKLLRKTYKIALDTNIFICALNKSDHRHKDSNFILNEIKNKKLEVTFSVLVIEEFFVRVYKEGKEKEKENILDFIRIGGLSRIIDVNEQIALKAAQIRAKYSSVKTPDAIHLASALESGARIFVTTDKRLPRKVDKLKIEVLTARFDLRRALGSPFSV